MRYEPDMRGQNFFALDTNLHAVLRRADGAAFERWRETLSAFGAWVGDEVDAEATYTDRLGRPTLESYDRDGEPVNRVHHNPLWETVSREVYRRGAVGLNYGDQPAPFLITFAMGYLLSQADVSLHCPVTMTGAVAFVLDRFAPETVRRRYLGELTRMDGAAQTAGTWATELHGGSDVGASTTVARGTGDSVRLDGLKWFVSNVGGDLAAATARPEGAAAGSAGLGLYLVPARLEDGSPNRFRVRRLKDKLGTCGIPTGEVELADTHAIEIAPPPQGFKLMMEALGFSRIHNAMASAGLQRRAFLEAISFADHRVAFGRTITDYPMVRDELLRIVVELEADTALAFSAARAFDAAAADEAERPWLRLATALAKHRTAEHANTTCRAAIEIIGGNGYVDDRVTPRLLRDAQVTTVWEGPANIQALEVLRMIGERYPGYDAFSERLETIVASAPAAVGDVAAGVEAALADCREAVALVRRDAAAAERHARRLMDLLADTLAAALLLDEASAGEGEGDARKSLLARRFMATHFAPPPRRGIVANEDACQRHFEAIIGYEAVSLAAAPRRAAG